ncbi:MAG TPA: ABC transporter substrate-binding protein [Mycobacteriales bacterium]|nr:ABC transporter substrate-binding protein [Mycobacteriales bacterium]
MTPKHSPSGGGKHRHGDQQLPGKHNAGPPATPSTHGHGHAPKPGKSGAPAPTDQCDGVKLASAQGVTPTEVRVDVAIVQLAGAVGNAAFNIPTNQVGIVNSVANYVNHHGGIACGRRLVVKIYKVNPIDSNSQQSSCLQMVQDRPIAVINTGAYVTPVSQECFVRNHLPLETGTSPGATQARNDYPYLFSPIDSSEQQVRNGILGAAARGYWKKPSFKKVFLFQDSCLPSANAEMVSDLLKSGVANSQIGSYKLTCELVGSPTQIAQSVAKAKSSGADTVFLASSILNNENFVSDAGQQNYHPRYLASDYGTTTLGSGSSKWAKNFDGAIAITSTHSGELNSHIYSPGLKLCNKIMVNNKQPTIKNENADDAAAGQCDQVRFMAQAIDNAGPNPSPLRLVQQLGTMSRFYSAYIGDSLWSARGQVTGNMFTRAIQWHGYCRCWKVLSGFGPSY